MKRILLVGGSSRLGQALSRQPGFEGLAIARAGPGCVQIADYALVTPSMLEGFDAVINLTGLTSGLETEMHSVNADLAGALAAKAAQAGVNQFVQISSFSVYGDAEEIRGDTQVAPISAYGRSRVAGEMAVREVETNNFLVMVARLPMLYGRGNSKLEKLVWWWLRAKRMPVPDWPICRSMLHYDLAAQALLVSIGRGVSGSVTFADGDAFQYSRAAQALSYGLGRPVGLIRLPAAIAIVLNRVRPVRQSLYASSLLNTNANEVVQMDLKSRLYDDLVEMARMAR